MKLTPADKIWAEEVKELDNHKCVICGVSERLNAHHIIPRQIKKFRWDKTNGISLCPKHHRFSFELSAHQNPLAFFKWMQKYRSMQLKYLLEEIR